LKSQIKKVIIFGAKSNMHLGILLGVSPQHLILRAQEWDEVKTIPEIGESVFDAQKINVGKIADIFGPVKKPFISISLKRNSGLTLTQYQEKRGESFYTLPPKKKESSSGNRVRHPSSGVKPRSGNPSLRGKKAPNTMKFTSQKPSSKDSKK
jgi:rRNA processing protein Gar1